MEKANGQLVLPEPSVIMITGTMAAGKSSVAQALAERMERSVHLRGDLFRRLIVRGQSPMGFELSMEAEAQLWLRYRLAAMVAAQYLEAGFCVVYQDIVIGPALAEVVALYRGHPLALFVLCPCADVLAARDAARGKTGYADVAAVTAFDHVVRFETPRLGYWLDNSDLTLDRTVDELIAHLHQAWLDAPAAMRLNTSNASASDGG